MFWTVEPFFDMTWRIDFFGKWVKYLNPFWTWLKELNFFHMTSRTQLFSKLAHRIEFIEVILSIEFFFLEKRRIERIEPFLHITQMIELFFCWKYDSKNLNFFFSIWLKELLQPFFSWFKYLDLFTWLKELNLLFHVTQILQLFQRNGPFFFLDSKFFHQKKKLTELNFESDPQNWIFLWLEPFNFLNMTQRIETFNFLNMTQRFEPFFQNNTQRIGFLYDTQRIELFYECDLKN